MGRVEAGRVRSRTGAVIAALIVISVGASCGGGSGGKAAAPPSAAPTTPAPTCDPPAPQGGGPAIHLCLAGPLSGSFSQLSSAATCSTKVVAGSTWEVEFPFKVGDEELTFRVATSVGPQTFDAAHPPSADTQIKVRQPIESREWTSALTGATGSYTVRPDGGGTAAVVLPAADSTISGPLPGIAPLTLNGSWTCS